LGPKHSSRPLPFEKRSDLVTKSSNVSLSLFLPFAHPWCVRFSVTLILLCPSKIETRSRGTPASKSSRKGVAKTMRMSVGDFAAVALSCFRASLFEILFACWGRGVPLSCVAMGGTEKRHWP